MTSPAGRPNHSRTTAEVSVGFVHCRRFRLLGSNLVSPVRPPGAFTCRRRAADLAKAKQSDRRSSAVMRSSTAVRPRPSEERAARTANTLVKGLTPRAAQAQPRPHPQMGCIRLGWHLEAERPAFPLSQAIPWAWLDLNQRPHPYQQSGRNRCAKRHSRRSGSTVQADVVCSHRVQLCALLTLPSGCCAVLTLTSATLSSLDQAPRSRRLPG